MASHLTFEERERLSQMHHAGANDKEIGATALAAGSIAILVYALCTAFCVLVPESTVVYVTTVFFHIDVSGLYRQITWGSFIASLLGWGLGTAVVAGATAWLYNRLARKDAEGSQFARRKDVASTPGELHEQR